MDAPRSERVIGRYVLHGEVAAGGMATVHLGRFLGPAGFSRTVAIKRLHPQFAKDPEFVSMFLDEARLAARIRHPNVVSVLDVVAKEGELFLVMDYIQGEALGRLLRTTSSRNEEMPLAVAVGIISGALRGLHAAHEATSEQGSPLGIVHRDVSPHNVLVGVDGVPNVIDFGVAKAANRFQTTREGQLKGKLGYMSPEQVQLERVDRRTDVYAASVVLWECLVGRRLFSGDDAAGVLASILDGNVPVPSSLRPNISPQLDAVVMRGLSLRMEQRFTTARDMAVALEDAQPAASSAKIGEWVERTAGEALQRRKTQVARVERASLSDSVNSNAERLQLREIPTLTELVLPEATVRDIGVSRGATGGSEEPTDTKAPSPHLPGLTSSAMSTTAIVRPPLRPRRRVLLGAGVLVLTGGLLVLLLPWSAVRADAHPPPSSSVSVPSPSLPARRDPPEVGPTGQPVPRPLMPSVASVSGSVGPAADPADVAPAPSSVGVGGAFPGRIPPSPRPKRPGKDRGFDGLMRK